MGTMKPDTAYMPVPRCDKCKYWERGKILVTQQPSFGGVCGNHDLRAFGTSDSESIETAQDFGCVQWEAKS